MVHVLGFCSLLTSSGLGAFADVTCHLAQCVREYSCDASSRHASFVAASARDSRVTERNQCSRSLAPAPCHSTDVMFRETRVGEVGTYILDVSEYH